MTLLDLKFYAVQNSEGKYFRRKGYGGYGETWVDEPHQARIYTKIGQARSIVTFFANHYKNYPVPSLVEIIPGTINVLSETDRVQKAVNKKKKELAASQLRQRQYELERAQKQLEEAQDKINKLS